MEPKSVGGENQGSSSQSYDALGSALSVWSGP